MRIVVVGAGGREHALAVRFKAEGHEVIGVPGNPGIAEVGQVVAVDLSDVRAVAEVCGSLSPALVVVGPEAPLAAGLADLLRNKRLPVFGPSARAAEIESSKAFAKEVMARAQVPTAAFRIAGDEAGLEVALAALGGSVAVKADGLAAGKGVVLCRTVEEARAAGRRLLGLGPVVVEELLSGPEVSAIVLTDGYQWVKLPPARDHKRLRDSDEGPNTGGMGAVCPVPLGDEAHDLIDLQIIAPVLATLALMGRPFAGALYVGLMLTPDGPKVLEFNARLGDPETQAICAALPASAKLGEVCLAAATGTLESRTFDVEGASCAIVIAAAGYPDAPRAGDEIAGLDEARALGATVLHAGTKRDGARLVTNGGRVLTVVATGATMAESRARALAAAKRIRLAGGQFRTDIGATS